MLTEARILIKPSERNKLIVYLTQIKAIASNLIGDKGIPYTTLLQDLNEFSKRGMLAPNLSVKYEMEKTGNRGAYHPDWETININLYYIAKVKAGITNTIVGIDYSLLAEILAHEFIHYKQDMKIRSRQYGRYLPFIQHGGDIESYFKDPQERQAWAAEYLEYIRNRLNSEKPDDALTFLKSVGLQNNPQLHQLKLSDYDSWKRIMKNAVEMAIHSVNQRKKART